MLIKDKTEIQHFMNRFDNSKHLELCMNNNEYCRSIPINTHYSMITENNISDKLFLRNINTFYNFILYSIECFNYF